VSTPLSSSYRDPLQTPIQYVKGVGPILSSLLERKGIRTVEEALYFLPRTYEDRRHLKKVSELKPGERQSGLGEVRSCGLVYYSNSKRRIFEVVVGDETGEVRLKWFRGNERSLFYRFRKGTKLLFTGETRWFNHQKVMIHPDVEVIGEEGEKDFLHFKRIVPIYSETEGLPQRTLRRILRNVLDRYASHLSSPIPADILRRQKLIDFREAFERVHFPPDEEPMEALLQHRSEGHRRIVFDELFFLQLGLALKKKDRELETGISFKGNGNLTERFLSHLPFRLTRAQERVFQEIREDMERPTPMNRLIQGDVGSGKTIVAFMACLVALECGYQASVMAPTEVLAEQHWRTLRPWAELLGMRIELLTGSIKGMEKESLYESVRRGAIDLLIGTHALIQEAVEFHRLGLAVIDEQHKFGVLQRAMLRKKGVNPDILVMTATPIPRTLAMTVYGDLDLSILDEMPPGRKPVETRYYPDSSRPRVYEIVREEIRKGRQAFFVCPLVEESEKLDLKDATKMAEHLQREAFPEVRVGLLHGRMGSEEKESVMKAFQEGQIQILVSTTVIEVGVDVPNASVMVVEHAERFGLSQLHQLRGRIGRGEHPSTCLLLTPHGISKEARARLRALVKTQDGFRIAEEDLTLRGPGEFWGTRQSGFPDLRAVHLVRDTPLLIEARKEAFRLVSEDPDLSNSDHRGLREAVTRKWKGGLELVSVA